MTKDDKSSDTPNGPDNVREGMTAGFERMDGQFKKIDQRFDKVDDQFKKVDQRFDKVDDQFKKVDQRFEKVDEQFKKVDQRFEKVDEQFKKVDRRFEKVDEQFKKVDRRFEKVDEQFKKVDRRFEKVDEQFKKVDQCFEKVDEQFMKVDDEFKAVRSEMKAGFTELRTEIKTEGETSRRYMEMILGNFKDENRVLIDKAVATGELIARLVAGNAVDHAAFTDTLLNHEVRIKALEPEKGTADPSASPGQ